MNQIKPYPKGRDRAKVPLLPILSTYLTTIKASSRSTFVAADVEGKMLRYERIYKGVKAISLELGFTIVTLHELRHSCTELWLEQGVSVEDLRRLLNHKSAKTTERYIQRTDRRLHEIASKLGDLKWGD
ncbi:MAG: site-specific integrase [Proteobacteria bacterium]|nr:MAG: site-specific integrase [Pseudomonadota bacterium]